jgi:Fur family ferric uptake transcriptional regulator
MAFLQTLAIASRGREQYAVGQASDQSGTVPIMSDVRFPDLMTTQGLLRERGLRWTPQRRAVLEVLSRTEGHVSGADLVERCRAIDPATTPSTVYRTLDVLEGLGIVRHGHGPDGREAYHVLPDDEHGHLHCRSCGASWNLDAEELRSFVDDVRERRGFVVDVSHVTVVGLCRSCAAEAARTESLERA